MTAPDLAAALRHLPHGPEFRFLDRLLTLDPGKSGVGEYTIRGDEPLFDSDARGQSSFPAVLLVEAAAQLAGVVAQSDPQIPPMPALKLTALRAVKILGAAKSGQVLCLEARISGRLANLVQAHATASAGDKLLMQAELTLSGAIG